MVFYPGGILSSNPVKPSTASASGLWSMTEQLQAQYSGTWPVTSAPAGSINVLVAMIGGGGGSTGGVSSVNYGAGGAGGVLRYANSVIIYGGGANYTVTIGAGGAGIATGTPSSGSNSTFSASPVVALGGNGAINTSTVGGNNADFIGGTGTGTYGAGGGAGAGGNGSGINGGPGANIAFSGAFVSYGGGGASINSGGNGTAGTGGGGAASQNGTNNFGGGAGGTSSGLFYNGGSGVVIINYPAPQYFTGGTVTNVNNLAGSNIVHTFTSSGSLTPLTTPIDTYQPYNTLLLHGDGSNGANNSVFLDGSANNLTITRNGTPTQGTFSPFATTGWSTYLNGSTDNLNIATTYALPTSTTSFTLECWVYPITQLSGTGILSGAYPSSGNIPFTFYGAGSLGGTTGSTLCAGYYNGSSWIGLQSSTSLTLNQWSHIALSYNGTTATLYLNGTSIGTYTGAWSTAAIQSTFYVGRRWDTAGTPYFNGYISNVRFVEGTAVYTSNFTPPISPLTAISGTKWLTSQSNRFVDNSTSPLTITTSGSPQVQPFSPFNPTAAYSNTSVGGSMYFNGSTDYLTLPSSTSSLYLTGAFTWEAWVYPTSTSGPQDFYGNWNNNTNNNWAFVYNNSGLSGLKLYWYRGNYGTNEAAIGTTNGLTINQWNHIAFVRDISNNIYIFINGVSQTLSTYGSSLTWSNSYAFTSTESIGIGGTSNYKGFTGYISNMKFVQGIANYTSNFTPPTSSATASANTQLLLSATNAGIIDNTQKNELITYGSASISTAQSKFGGTSIFFNGTSDYIQIPSNTRNIIGTVSATVEFWIYPADITSYRRIITSTNGGFNAGTFCIRFNSGGNMTAGSVYSNPITASSQPTLNAWNHVAWVGTNGTSQQLFINGLSVGTSTSYNITEAIQYIGGYYSTGPAEFYSGYIDDLRVTVGTARYTANFTPPTTAFLNT